MSDSRTAIRTNAAEQALRASKLFTISSALVLLLSQTVFSAGFDWLIYPGAIKSDTIELSIGATHYRQAPFPFSGLEGDLKDYGLIDFRIGASQAVGFRVSGAMRRVLNLNNSPLVNPATSGSATGDFSLSAIWRFYENTQMSLGFMFGLTMPNTNVSSGLGLDQGTQFARGALALKASEANIVFNLGIAIMNDPTLFTGQDDFVTFGVGMAYPISERIDVASEFYGIDGPDDGAEDGLFDSLAIAVNTTVKFNSFFLTTRAVKYLADVAPDYSFSLAIGTRFRYRNH